MGITERKEREREQRYQAIIDAGEKVFFTKGYESSTMDDVAVEAELSKGTLYLYFTSKDELHFAIMERGMKLLMGLMEKRLHISSNGIETLRELGLALVEFSNLHPNYFNALIFFQGRDVELQKLQEAKVKDFLANRNSLTVLNETLKRGMADGSIRTDIPIAELSTTLWAQMMGILVMYSAKQAVFKLHHVGREQLVNSHLMLLSDALKPSHMEGANHE
ncbi:MAG: TetR/AcrR family transcriptional regulator [Bacteroidales bacterium]|nr:TetR/AcrR family transcriptional regulator [Bacteroidales bacterium]